MNFFYPQSLRYLAQLFSSFEIYIEKFEKIDILPFRMLIEDFSNKLDEFHLWFRYQSGGIKN